jgi:NifB/MoaA-like Fe-S oxidoreductase
VSLGARPSRAAQDAPITILTGGYGSLVLRPLLDRHGFGKVRILAVSNEFFGGNIAVAGLITGADLSRTLAEELPGGRYLLPDVCLSKDRFIDGPSLQDLPLAVEVVATDGASLRRLLEAGR